MAPLPEAGLEYLESSRVLSAAHQRGDFAVDKNRLLLGAAAVRGQESKRECD